MRRGHTWHIGWRWIAVLAGVAVPRCLPVLTSALPARVPPLPFFSGDLGRDALR